ncbi:MAG: MBL fold metallo-hydrolase [Deltaproteobacteria bacterium]|nr:MAG: MBL fold metallo-hydrolase [Deltaproteobacteria bacterium]
MSDKWKITIVCDNNPYLQGLKTEWGFSALISSEDEKILFDTAESDSILRYNMDKLGINPKEINKLFLSHAHGDHTGGLGYFLSINPYVSIYFPKSFPDNFSKQLTKIGSTPIPIKDAYEISKNISSTGELLTGFIPEHAMVISTPEGLVIITGCAHPGLIHIVEKAKMIYKSEPYLLLGGFHFFDKGLGDVFFIANKLKEMGIKYVAPCHCTGQNGIAWLHEIFGNNLITVGVGKVVELPIS